MIKIPFPDNDITGDDEKLYVAEIQEKLLALELAINGFSQVPVDGIYGPMTTAAVERFQRQYRLPVTGTVDRQTYYRLVEEYNRLLARTVTVIPINAFRSVSGYMLRNGDTGDVVYFLNIMINTLSNFFKNIPPVPLDDTYGEATQAAVTALQKIIGLPPTGVVNLQTWNRITALYNDLTGEFLFGAEENTL